MLKQWANTNVSAQHEMQTNLWEFHVDFRSDNFQILHATQVSKLTQSRPAEAPTLPAWQSLVLKCPQSLWIISASIFVVSVLSNPESIRICDFAQPRQRPHSDIQGSPSKCVDFCLSPKCDDWYYWILVGGVKQKKMWCVEYPVQCSKWNRLKEK